MTPKEIVDIPDAGAMREFGRSFADRLSHGDVVLLHGDLGAGKTTLTQGIAAGLGVREPVQSPTFSIVAEHDGVDSGGDSIKLYHIDLYRLTDAAELEGLNYEQYLDPGDGISIIEWPERAGDWLPDRFWLLRIMNAPSGGRRIDLSRHGVGTTSE